MTTKRFTMFAIVLAAFVLLVGCKKEKTEERPNASTKASVDMLQFQSSEDFFNYLEKAEVNNEKVGFISFGKMADDAYYSIVPEEMFSSMDEVIDYVLEHRDLFQLILGSDGEYTIETRMYDHPFRNVANTDGIFQVGDTLYKIIEDGYVYTSLDKMDCLKQYADNGYRQNTSSLKFFTFKRDVKNVQNRDYPFCPDQMYNEKVNGNNKITLKISYITDGPINNLYEHGYEYLAKPYHKSIGWWGCNRTITANVYEITLGAPGGIFNMSTTCPQIINYVKSGSSLFLTYSITDPNSTGNHIYSCYCSANTLDSGTVYVSCHGD